MIWIIAIAVMLATFMEVLDTSIAAVSLPYIAGSLSATNDEATWVLTSYLVSNAVVLPASGWFSLRFGRKRFLITCIIIFTISSFICGVRHEPGHDPDRARNPGSRWRRTAADVSSDPAGNFPAGEARDRHGRIRPGCRRGARARAHSWRMDHRNLHMALGLLHQRSHRHPRGAAHIALRAGSALHSQGKAGAPRRHRARIIDGMAGRAADHSRQGTGRRLVRRHLASVGVCNPDHGLRRLHRLGAHATRSPWST